MALKSNRKGMAISLNWIFSMIAGVLILIFLVYFAVQNTDLFGSVTSKVVSQELDILFSGIETTKTKTSLDFGKNVELRFSCNNGNQILSVNGKGESNLHGKIIFAPNIVESNTVEVATEPWKVPYRIANFVYLWNEDYSLIGSVPMDIDLLDDLRGNGRKVTFKEDFGVGCSVSESTKTIYYKYDRSLDDYQGYVCFNGNDERKKSEFYGKAMLIGAVISESYENFECLKNGMQKKLDIMNLLYQKKSEKMIASSEDNKKLWKIYFYKINSRS